MSKSKSKSRRKKSKKPVLPPHPMQPVHLDARCVLRFRANAIVRAILDRDMERGRVYPEWPARTDGGLNWIGEQSYVSDESCARARVLAEQVTGGCRDAGCSINGGPLFDETENGVR